MRFRVQVRGPLGVVQGFGGLRALVGSVQEAFAGVRAVLAALVPANSRVCEARVL